MKSPSDHLGVQEMKQPIDYLLDQVAWTEVWHPTPPTGPLPHVTHKGVLKIGDIELNCYVLSDGQRIFNADDVERMFGLRRQVKP
jgi:hypothetical protein